MPDGSEAVPGTVAGMRVALVVVSIVAILAIGALAAVLITGWTITGDDPEAVDDTTQEVTDAQAVWCESHTDRLLVAADTLDIHNTDAAETWRLLYLPVEGLVTDWDDRLDNLLGFHRDALIAFGAWLDEKGHTPSSEWSTILAEDAEIRRTCLAAWGAAFGTTPRDSD